MALHRFNTVILILFYFFSQCHCCIFPFSLIWLVKVVRLVFVVTENFSVIFSYYLLNISVWCVPGVSYSSYTWPFHICIALQNHIQLKFFPVVTFPVNSYPMYPVLFTRVYMKKWCFPEFGLDGIVFEDSLSVFFVPLQENTSLKWYIFAASCIV